MPYFDHNATTPLLPAAREAWLRAADEAWQNPSSPYRASARVHRLLAQARARVAAALGAEPEEIVFTSGATEANNAVLAWAARTSDASQRALVSPTEHPSVLEPARAHWSERVQALAVDGAGRVGVAEFAQHAREGRIGLAVVMAANNETGALAPLAEVGRVVREHDIAWLCDASQWIGRLPARELPANAWIVASAHKWGGPKGVGFLRVPKGASGFRGQLGGGQEQSRRGGTENYPAIAAMVAALEAAEAWSREDRLKRAAWRDAFVRKLASVVPGVHVNGPRVERLWNTLSLRLPAHDNTRWVARLDKLGFEVSTGSACATGSDAPSHVLAAMGLTPEEARRTIRLSAGWETTKDDWRALAVAVAEVWRELEAEAQEPGAAVVINA